MRRRSVLLGLGTAAAGSGIAFGSGAFTQVQASRDVTIGISEDSNSLLALEAGDVSSVGSENGELFINTEELSDGNEGFNVGSTVLIGETKTDIIDREPQDAVVVPDIESNGGQTGAAFKITNNIDNTADSDNQIDLAVNLENLDDGDGELTFIISEYESGSSTSDDADNNYTVSGGSQVIINDLTENDELYFAIEIETGSTTSPADFNGEVTFRAGPDLGEGSGFPTDAEALEEIVNVTQNVAVENSIQAAIDGDGVDNYNGANPGDLIQVPSGDYEESVTIDVEGLTLEGPNAGIAGSNSAERDPEATITDQVAWTDTDDVTVDGFEVEAVVEPADAKRLGVFELGQAGPAKIGDNAVIKNNVINPTEKVVDQEENYQVIVYEAEQTDELRIESNLIKDGDGDVDFVGVRPQVDPASSPGVGEGLEVLDNTFETTQGVSLSTDVTGTVTGNEFNTSSQGLSIGENANPTIEDNDFNEGGAYVVVSQNSDVVTEDVEQNNNFDKDTEIDEGSRLPGKDIIAEVGYL